MDSRETGTGKQMHEISSILMITLLIPQIERTLRIDPPFSMTIMFFMDNLCVLLICIYGLVCWGYNIFYFLSDIISTGSERVFFDTIVIFMSYNDFY